jgi:hypothetical protein
VGDQWYNIFIKRHKEELRQGQCKIQDTNQLTWCTKENFQNMYSCVYESMVEAGVAVKFDEKLMLDINNKITLIPEEMYSEKTR